MALPFGDGAFEVVACFEVLEHLTYADFPKALGEIYRVSTSHAVLSLPDLSRVYRVDIQIPKIGIKRLIPLPRLKSLRCEFNCEHFWSIGTAGYPLRKIVTEIENGGFEIEKNYRVFEISWHRFFVLTKARGNLGTK